MTAKATIFVVDDSPENLCLMGELLKNEGHAVRTFSNGADAIGAAQKVPPDLIILDIMMPDMDGYNVCERLRADLRTEDIPVMFISALDAAFDIVKGFNSGGTDYLARPFEPEELLVRVNASLRVYRLQRELRDRNQELSRQMFERKQVEQQLRKLSRAVEQSGSTIVITDRRGVVESENSLGSVRCLPEVKARPDWGPRSSKNSPS